LVIALYAGAVRAIAIATAVFLVVVAAAFGSPQRTGVAQKPVEAPQPATRQVACVTATSCVSIGGSHLLVERAGKWTSVHEPASVNLRSLACPQAGRCVAVGFSGERAAAVVTQTGTTWHLTIPTLPGAPATTSFPALSAVSCSGAGACGAVGSYLFPLDTPLVVRAQNWGDATEPALPANAATSRDPSHAHAGGGLSLVSCASADCTAAGTYTNKDAQYSDYGWFLTGPTPAMAQLPAGAATFGDSERGGTSPFLGFAGLSCPSAGRCTAVGGYVDSHDDERGVIFTELAGSGWARGVAAPVPANAAPNVAPPNEFENPLASLSCAAPSDCAAVGWYVDKSKHRRGLLLTERSGKWRASELVLPVGAPRNSSPNLGAVTCASRGNCLAIGDYASAGKTYGLIVVERGGKWGRGIRAGLPRNASRASHTFLNSAACASAKSCTAVGTYADRSGKTRGLILSLRLP
jgi:hypothetical protein